jgi:putative Mg2+ transporter-C (MgtC) family protein
MLALSIPGADPNSFSRVLQGLVSGIGFIGAGAILRDGHSVHGTATAASVWCTAIVGAAVGLGEYHIAVILSLFNYLTLRFLIPWKASARSGDLQP